MSDHLRATKEKVGAGSSLKSIWNALFRIKYLDALQSGAVTFVIDGVDNLEATTRKMLYRLLRYVLDESKANGQSPVKVVALSQTQLEPEISKFMPTSLVPRINITEDRNREDIETFLLWTVQNSPKLSRALRDPTFKDETVKKTAKTTRGIFERMALVPRFLREQKIS